MGRAGQHIFVYPAEDLVVVFTGDLPYENDADLTPLQALLDRFILPAVKSDRPLPADADSVARLRANLQALAEPPRITLPALPALAAKISGGTYALEDNPLGWQAMVLRFESGSDQATVTVDGTQFSIGLDNVYRVITGQETQFPEGLRGSWEDENTLVIDDLVIGGMVQGAYRIRFSGDAIDVTRHEKYSGSEVKIRGTADPTAGDPR